MLFAERKGTADPVPVLTLGPDKCLAAGSHRRWRNRLRVAGALTRLGKARCGPTARYRGHGDERKAV